MSRIVYIKKVIMVIAALMIVVGGMYIVPERSYVASMQTVSLTIGGKTFKAAFEDNKTARELLKKLPETYKMSELNGNEKYKYLNYDLPENKKAVKMIKKGDIMLYGSDCLVIFYKSFKTTYSYTRIGRITNTKGLEKAVGKGSVKVKFKIIKKTALNKKRLTIKKGETYKLKLDNAKAAKVKWSSSNNKIATVRKGKVTAKKPGRATITAKYGKKKYRCNVTVVNNTASIPEATKPADQNQSEGQQDQTKPQPQVPSDQDEGERKDSGIEETKMKLRIGDQELDVLWEENESVKALEQLVRSNPVSIDMSMYGGFEQVGPLGTKIPSNDKQTETEAGDIVLYQGNQIVVFYGSNSWSYTKLGKIKNMSAGELEDLLGKGNVTIIIEMEE